MVPTFLLSEHKAKKAVWEIHREHADSEYKIYMDAKEASIGVCLIYFLLA
jgi:hypothetical protein